MTLKKLVLITAGAMLLSGTAMAKNINVPGDFAKIADALGNADAGDTILVKRGVYNENITLIMGVVLKGEDPFLRARIPCLPSSMVAAVVRPSWVLQAPKCRTSQ